jgi:hypothetical protein
MKLQGVMRFTILLARLLGHYRAALSSDQLRSIVWQSSTLSCP